MDAESMPDRVLISHCGLKPEMEANFTMHLCSEPEIYMENLRK